MNKYRFATVAVIAVLAITLCLIVQPADAAGGGRGGGRGFGGRMTMSAERPDRDARLATVKELESQIATLKAAIEKAPAQDPNFAALSTDELTKAMEYYQAESDAVQAIQTSLASLNGGGMMRMSSSNNDLADLRVLAKSERATKTVDRIDALIKEQLVSLSANTRGGRGGGRGGRGSSYTPPPGGFQYND